MYTVKLFVQNPLTGEMQPRNEKLTVMGPTVDLARKQVLTLMDSKKMPPARSVNLGPGNTLVVYCSVPSVTPERTDETKDLRFRKPPKLTRKK